MLKNIANSDQIIKKKVLHHERDHDCDLFDLKSRFCLIYFILDHFRKSEEEQDHSDLYSLTIFW